MYVYFENRSTGRGLKGFGETLSQVFDLDYWENHRSSYRYWRHLRGLFTSHIIRSLAWPVGGVTSIAVAVVLYHMLYDQGGLPVWAPILDLTSAGNLYSALNCWADVVVNSPWKVFICAINGCSTQNLKGTRPIPARSPDQRLTSPDQ